MARKSNEFKLVLLGAGILTAGYFLWPQPDPVKEADEEAAKQVAGAHHRTHHHTGLIFIPTGYGRSSAPVGGASGLVSSGGVSRGGFGALGRGRVGIG